MSKIKKKQPPRFRRDTKEEKLEKSMNFTGWIFLLTLGIFLGIWFIFDDLLNITFIDFQLNALTFSFIIFTGTSSAFSFGLATLIKNNRDIRRKIFFDFLIGEFLLCMFAVFSLAAYQF
jgi:hypothetical protein